jgi:hypothetical protein
MGGEARVLETCCIIGTWVQDHLLREVWPDPLVMSPRVEARVFLCHRPWRSDRPLGDRSPLA